MSREVLLPRRIAPGAQLAEDLGRHLSRDPDSWFADVESADRIVLLRLEAEPLSMETGYQQLELIHTSRFGRCLVLDGRLQLADSDEFIYHELLIHPAMSLARERRSALVMGGGDGCALREVLRWPCIERAVMVELDPEVVRVTREHCPHWSDGAFDNERAELRIEDCIGYLEAEAHRWDLIVADLTEPFDETGQAGDLSSSFFGRRALELVRGRLAPGGIFVAQTGGIQVDPDLDRHHQRLVAALREVFPWVHVACEYVPSFEELWTVTLAGLEPPAPVEVDRRLATEAVTGLRFYDARTHERVLCTPGFVAGASDPSTHSPG